MRVFRTTIHIFEMLTTTILMFHSRFIRMQVLSTVSTVEHLLL